MASERSKKLVLIGSVIASIAIAVGMWVRAKNNAPMVEVIDNREELVELITKEAKAKEGLLIPLSADFLVRRKKWNPDLASKIFPMLRLKRAFTYDQELGCRRSSDFVMKKRFAEHPNAFFMVETNSIGLKDEEISDSAEYKILFAGDSQSEGVCGTDETFINLLEFALEEKIPDRELQSINAAMGGSDPWRYLATLEYYSRYEPDLFAPVFYGGNDFREVMALERVYRGRRSWLRTGSPDYQAGIAKLPVGMGAVELRQVQFFSENPDDVEISVMVWVSIAMEMSRKCTALGIDYMPIYLPPPLVGQPDAYAPDLELVAEHLPKVAKNIALSDEMADRWIEELRSRDVEVLDLRPALKEAEMRLFWEDGFHLNLVGHQFVADALQAAFLEHAKAHFEGIGR